MLDYDMIEAAKAKKLAAEAIEMSLRDGSIIVIYHDPVTAECSRLALQDALDAAAAAEGGGRTNVGDYWYGAPGNAWKVRVC